MRNCLDTRLYFDICQHSSDQIANDVGLFAGALGFLETADLYTSNYIKEA